MNSPIYIESSEEIKETWNSFEKIYTKYFANNVFSIYPIMSNLAKINRIFSSTEEVNVLELAIGGGDGVSYLISQARLYNSNNKVINIYCTDIAQNMLDNAFNKFKTFTDVYVGFGIPETQPTQSIRVYLHQADNENLPFKDEMFDIVFSSLSLHIVTNPDAMLRETSRVLKDDCYSSFSVWGRQENSKIFTLLPKSMQNLGVSSLYKSRSQFYLSDYNKVKELALSNGYKLFNYCYSFIPFQILNSKDYEMMYKAPNSEKSFGDMDQELVKKIKDDVNAEIEQILNSGELIGLEALIVIVKK